MLIISISFYIQLVLRDSKMLVSYIHILNASFHYVMILIKMLKVFCLWQGSVRYIIHCTFHCTFDSVYSIYIYIDLHLTLLTVHFIVHLTLLDSLYTEYRMRRETA